MEFVPGTNEADGYAGDTFFLNKEQQYDQQVAVDFDARRLLVGSRKSGVRHFWIFDLDEVLALPLKEMTVSITVGAEGLLYASAYVTVFNYNGRIVVPRTEVAAIADVNGLASEGFTQTGYAEGECIKVKEGKLYLGMACRDGSSSNRYANILVYDCVKKQ